MLLFAFVLAVYLANNRVLAEVDCVAAPYTAWSLVRHGSIDVRRYPELARFVENRALWETSDGRWISIRPIGSALAALPFVAPLAIAREQPLSFEGMLYLGKIVAAVCVALAAVVFWTLCLRVAPEAATPATALFAFGTVLWTVGSQALWTHGPATLGVTLGLAAAFPAASDRAARSRPWLASAGFAFAFLCRETTVVFALAAVAALLLTNRRRDASILIIALAAAACFVIAYNLRAFGHPLLGGYANDHWTQGTPLIGITGLIVAPSRGVMIYSPALVVCFYGLAVGLRQDHHRVLLLAMAAAAIVTVIIYGSWYDWRGGWSYGPRFLAETMPVACMLVAIGYRALGATGRRAAQVLVALSVAVQVLGITGYAAHAPWHRRHDLDDHGRSLFSVRDTEIEAHGRAALAHLRRVL